MILLGIEGKKTYQSTEKEDHVVLVQGRGYVTAAITSKWQFIASHHKRKAISNTY